MRSILSAPSIVAALDAGSAIAETPVVTEPTPSVTEVPAGTQTTGDGAEGGAASGASAGAVVGRPVGAAVGAVAGGVFGDISEDALTLETRSYGMEHKN